MGPARRRQWRPEDRPGLAVTVDELLSVAARLLHRARSERPSQIGRQVENGAAGIEYPQWCNLETNLFAHFRLGDIPPE